MSLENKVVEEIKVAMKSRDKIALEVLRSIKSNILLVRTSGNLIKLSKEDEIKLIEKMVKQRKDSAKVYLEKGRKDLSDYELSQVNVLNNFLPEPINQDKLEAIVIEIISKIGAISMKDMGKVMREVTAEVAGRADGKTISKIVKKLLLNKV